MFWGAQVQFNQKFVPEKEDYAYLHLRNVSTLWANEQISLVCNIKKQENGVEEEINIVLCHLDEKKNTSAQLNLYFDLKNQDISFTVIGKGKVCLMGSLEAKEGKALTNELVKNLGPQIADAKKKMILELAGLVKDMKGKGGDQQDDNDEDLDDEEEYVEGMDLESDGDEEENEDEGEDDDEEEEEEESENSDQIQKQIVEQKKSQQNQIQSKNNNNQNNNQANNQKADKKPAINQNQQQKQNKQGDNKLQQKNNVQNQNQSGKKGNFHISYNYKPKNQEEIEKDEFAAI
ncbi:hypothetical protein ABPG72_002339 [Tetrahymena utriculariae]